MTMIRNLVVPFTLAMHDRGGLELFGGVCPDCGEEIFGHSEHFAEYHAADHVCDPENVRTTAVVWTHNPGEDIKVLWGLDAHSEIITANAIACSYCREHGPFGDLCPGPVAHALRQRDQEVRLHGHAASAALVRTPAASPQDMLQLEVLTRILCGTLRLEHVRADHVVRIVLGETGTQHVAYCFECATARPGRGTAAEAVRDAEAHRCDPAQVRAVAVLWTELGDLDAVIVASRAEQADAPGEHEKAIAALADELRPQTGDVLHMGVFTVPAGLSEEQTVTELDVRLERLLNA
ncbi:hypothetical protein [Lentzea sp. CA-135723]|uniref:hypothetical protein n=1 Tax=Lentzea sp. CA-135723 TaxID=3239950 RepID=UPI003D8EE1D1